MRPAILIIERQREIADALEAVVTSANYQAIVRPYIERLADVGVTPAAIVVRIAFEGVTEPPHAALAAMPLDRPPVIAIVSEDAEMAEAIRLNCDVVLRAPHDVGRFYEVLTRLVPA